VQPADDQSAALRIPLDVIPGTTGHLLLAEGPDENGAHAVAVWQLTPTGRPCGAWITPVEVLAGDADAAARLLGLGTGRAVVGWDTGTAMGVLGRLSGWAGVEQVRPRVEVLLGDVLAEVTGHRVACEQAVADYRSATKSKIEPLAWYRDVPPGGSWDEFVESARLRPPAGASALATEVLHLARATAWVADLWQDTETVRGRRRYLVDRFGPAAPLPPDWLDRLRTAHGEGRG
jgi:hypothetical protein